MFTVDNFTTAELELALARHAERRIVLTARLVREIKVELERRAALKARPIPAEMRNRW